MADDRGASPPAGTARPGGDDLGPWGPGHRLARRLRRCPAGGRPPNHAPGPDPGLSMRIVATPFSALTVMLGPRESRYEPRLREALVAPTPAILSAWPCPGCWRSPPDSSPDCSAAHSIPSHRALSAAALARELESRWQRPVVPFFWSAGDDHDFAEANHASWLGLDGRLVTAVLRERATDSPLTALSREQVGPEVEPVLESSRPTCPRVRAAIPPWHCSGGTTARRRRWPPPPPGGWPSSWDRYASRSSTRPIRRPSRPGPLVLSALERQSDRRAGLTGRNGVLSRGEGGGRRCGDGASMVI